MDPRDEQEILDVIHMVIRLAKAEDREPNAADFEFALGMAAHQGRFHGIDPRVVSGPGFRVRVEPSRRTDPYRGWYEDAYDLYIEHTYFANRRGWRFHVPTGGERERELWNNPLLPSAPVKNETWECIDCKRVCGGYKAAIPTCIACERVRAERRAAVDLFDRIVRVIGNAIALNLAAALSLRPSVVLGSRQTIEMFVVCVRHGYAKASTGAVAVATPTGGKSKCKGCHEHEQAVDQGFRILDVVCRFAIDRLAEQVDDATKRFAMIEFDSKPPIPDNYWTTADDRFALIELRDQPLPVRPPPAPYVRPARLDRPSEIDQRGGVDELLLELD